MRVSSRKLELKNKKTGKKFIVEKKNIYIILAIVLLALAIPVAVFLLGLLGSLFYYTQGKPN